MDGIDDWFEKIKHKFGYNGEALVIAFIYFVMSVLWIVISDKALTQFIDKFTPENIQKIQTIKGIAFVILSSLVLFLLLKRSFGKIKQKNEELYESERTFSNLIHNLPGFFYRCKNDRNWTMVFINESSRILTGYQAEELLYNEELSFNDLIHPDDQQRVYDEVQTAVNEGKRFKVYYRLLTKDGQMKWVWEQGLMAFEDNGEEYLEGYVTDVTDVHFLRQALEEKHNYYKMLLDNANDGIYVLDVDPEDSKILGFKEVNKVASKRLGIERSELLKLNPNDLELFRENVSAHIPEILKTGTVQFDTHFFDKENRKKHSEFSAHLFSANSENLILAISRDITDRVRFEDKLKVRNQELQTLLYKASHDLRSPVTNILGLVNLGRNENGNQENDYFYWINQSAEQLLYIIESLNAASEAIKGNVKLEYINLEQLLEKQKVHFKSLKGFENVSLQIQINETGQEFYSDKDLLESILNNIIGNAFKFRARSNPVITIKSKRVEGMIEIEITDNGIGIDEAIQDRIFDMFYRGNIHSKGSGLGLYIVKNALDKLNGRITFESKPEQGTTFKVLIPSLA